MHQNQKAILFILSALLQKLTLGTYLYSSKTQIKLNVTLPTKTINQGNDIILHENRNSPTKTDHTDNDFSQESLTTPKNTDNPIKYLSHNVIDSQLNLNNPENYQFEGSDTSPTKTDNPKSYVVLESITPPTKIYHPGKKPSVGRVPLPTKTDITNNPISHRSISSPNKKDKTDDLSQRSVTLTDITFSTKCDQPQKIITLATSINTPEMHSSFKSTSSQTEVDNTNDDISQGSVTVLSNPETNISHVSTTLSIKIDNPEIGLSHGNNSLLNRRQYPKQSVPFRPPSESKIAQLLNEYRGIVNKYSSRNLEALPQKTYALQNQPGKLRAENIEQFYIGQRGPIRHSPHRTSSKPTAMARQGLDEEAQKKQLQETNDGNAGGNGPEQRKDAPESDEKLKPAQMTTQNEAMGAASRFTTRTTTTRRRRRTTPERVSFKEDCDYIAYYCLKAFDTGKVCGRTLYFIHMTFENYCMIDYVNCMERFNIWQIAHMGECFEIKVLKEYRHYPYNDDYFLDNYYIVEDM